MALLLRLSIKHRASGLPTLGRVAKAAATSTRPWTRRSFVSSRTHSSSVRFPGRLPEKRHRGSEQSLLSLESHGLRPRGSLSGAPGETNRNGTDDHRCENVLSTPQVGVRRDTQHKRTNEQTTTKKCNPCPGSKCYPCVVPLPTPALSALRPLRGEGVVSMAPMRVHVMCRWKLSMRPSRVAADVRRPALSLSKGAHSIPTRSPGKRSEPFDRLRVCLVTAAAT